MRKIFFLLLMAMMQHSLYAAKADEVRLKVMVNGYESGCVTLAHGHDYDTLKMDKKGRFDLQCRMAKPNELMIVVDQFRSGVVLYLENGMKGTLTLSFKPEPNEGQIMYVGSYEYKGTKKDCMDFYRNYNEWENNGWSFQKIAQYDFLTYRQEMEKEVAAFREQLGKISSDAFKQRFLKRLDAREKENLMRFAWAKHEVDPAFEKYIGSFERNSKEHLSMAADYQRWWLGTHRPAEGHTSGTWYMYGLQQNFTDQEVINTLASSYMDTYIPRAPKDLAATWEAYSKICSDKKAIDELQILYDKFNPGTDAPDFEITGYSDGKAYSLKDFRGKALYIDWWATWCGPCMAEMPHMSKLYEHFKNDDRIELIGVSFDSDRKKLDKELQENQHPWRQFWCQDAFNASLAKAYGFSGIPRFIFIDKNGKLIAGDAPRPSSEFIIQYIKDKLK